MASTAVPDEPASSTESKPTDLNTPSIVHIGSRQSALALIQTAIVRQALEEAWPNTEYQIHAMSTAGDKNQTTALHDFGAKSLWTYELEALLLEEKLDLIVHSLKGGIADPFAVIPKPLGSSPAHTVTG